MANKPSEETTNKKSTLIGFAIGFVIAFSLAWFYFSRTSEVSTEDQIPAGELMQKKAAASPRPAAVGTDAAAVVESPVVKSSYSGGDKLATQLIASLFTDSEKGRKQAKKDLVKQFHDNSSVMKELIDKCSAEFDKKDRDDNGIFQGIDVLLMVSEKSPKTLEGHRDVMYAFFEKTREEYREETQERMEKIMSRVGQ